MKPIPFMHFVAGAMLFLAAPAMAQSSVTGSDLSAMGSVKLIEGSADLLSAGGHLTVASVETVGEVTTVVLTDASKATEGVVKLVASGGAAASQAAGTASQGAGIASLAAGASIATAAVSTGTVLINSAGDVVAFVPHDDDDSMFLHSKHKKQ